MWPHVPAPGQKPLNRTQYHRGRNLSQNHKRKKPHETRKGNSLTSRRQQAWASDESSESSGAHRRISAWERADLSGDERGKGFSQLPCDHSTFSSQLSSSSIVWRAARTFHKSLRIAKRIAGRKTQTISMANGKHPFPWRAGLLRRSRVRS